MMNPDLLVVLIRDIARAEREGRCTQEYMASVAQVMREVAIASEEAPPRSESDVFEGAASVGASTPIPE